ncbi:MAG TPA: sensor histidine kinase [Anaerolineaceae bacterium]|nr:sensor histidine kinase [Anaerolineaceae bacterium]
MPSRLSVSGSTTTDWVAYLTIIGVAVLGFSSLPAGTPLWPAVILLVLFTVAFVLSPSMPAESRAAHHTIYAYLIGQTILIAGLMLLLPEKHWAFAILFFVLSSQVVTLISSPACYAWIGLFTAAAGLIFILKLGFPAGLYEVLPFTGGYFFFGAFTYAWAEADSARRQNQRLLNDLAEQHRRLQEYAARVEVLTEAQERSRLAREIHDTLGHVFTTLDVQLELLKRLPMDQEEQRRRIVIQAQEMVRQGLADTRRTVHAIQPVGLESLSLVEAVGALVSNFQDTCGLPVTWETAGELTSISPRLVLPLYRVAQEALTNIRKHAPNAAFVQVHLERMGATLCLSITNGPSQKASPGPGSGQGLAGLKERVEALGGSFQAGLTPEGGFQVRAEITE